MLILVRFRLNVFLNVSLGLVEGLAGDLFWNGLLVMQITLVSVVSQI